VSPIVTVERAMVVSYAPVVNIALSLTIRPKMPSNICDTRFDRVWVTSVGSKILRCSLWNKSVMLASAESEHHRLTNSEIIFGDFQPM